MGACTFPSATVAGRRRHLSDVSQVAESGLTLRAAHEQLQSMHVAHR